jgi:hypothetical protein
MATLNGKPVDRPAVSFYEISGNQDTTNPDPFNIYSDPSWRPLIELARDKTDCIVMYGVWFKNQPPNPQGELFKTDVRYENGSRLTTTTIKAGKRTLTCRSRQDPDVNTVWTLEHFLKDADDFRAWLDLPDGEFGGEPETTGVLAMEKRLDDSGIVMIDTFDPLCCVAPLFEMGEFTVIAMSEPELFHRALEKVSRHLYKRTEAVAKALPGRLWRIYGPEYASPPYLPPHLFKEYVTRYITPMVQTIQKYGGFARIHSHGRLHDILDHIVATGCMGLDPIEPPPQGDVSLAYVREKYGRQLVLFGNLEASDIENLPPEQFREKVARALREGTVGKGRGFVLMPSACPYGRKLSSRSMKNYEIMVEMTERF